MPAKKKTPAKKQKPQKQRFIEFAKEVGADDDEALERAFGKAVPAKRPKT
jgi:hypothetical protein